jgi:hypothetical protein
MQEAQSITQQQSFKLSIVGIACMPAVAASSRGSVFPAFVSLLQYYTLVSSSACHALHSALYMLQH